MPNETTETEGRRVAPSTLRSALLWVAVGAGLFLGVGAALPLWPTDVIFHGAGFMTVVENERVPLWMAVRGLLWPDRIAVALYGPPSVTDVAPGVAGLLAGGAVAGLLAGILVRRQRKGDKQCLRP